MNFRLTKYVIRCCCQISTSRHSQRSCVSDLVPPLLFTDQDSIMEIEISVVQPDATAHNEKLFTLYPLHILKVSVDMRAMTAMPYLHILLSRSLPANMRDRLVVFGIEESRIEDELAQWDFSGLNYTIITPMFVRLPSLKLAAVLISSVMRPKG